MQRRLKLTSPRTEPPAPDDGPDPELLTPRRVAAKLRRMAMTATSLAHDLRELAFPIGKVNVDEAHDELMRAAAAIVDLAVNVRSGIVAIRKDYLDAERVPARELLDYIESRPLRETAAGIAPAIAARQPLDTDPAWEPGPMERAQAAHEAEVLARAAEESEGDDETLAYDTIGAAERAKRRHDAAVKANETRKRQSAAPAPAWSIEYKGPGHTHPLKGERLWLAYDREERRIGTISAVDKAQAQERVRQLIPGIGWKFKVVPWEDLHPGAPDDGRTVPPPQTEPEQVADPQPSPKLPLVMTDGRDRTLIVWAGDASEAQRILERRWPGSRWGCMGQAPTDKRGKLRKTKLATFVPPSEAAATTKGGVS